MRKGSVAAQLLATNMTQLTGIDCPIADLERIDYTTCVAAKSANPFHNDGI